MGKRKKMPAQQAKTSPAMSETTAWVVLGLIVLFYTAIRIRFLAIPIERDEGEYAYAGQLILHGIPPYKLAYNMKIPGIYYAYALVMAIFGQSVIGIHVGLMLVNIGAIVLLYLIAKRLFDPVVGLVTVAAYGFLTINQFIFGSQAHATHFVVLPALGGILLAMKAVESRKISHLVLSGLLLGVSFTMKQQGVFFIAFTLIYLVWNQARNNDSKPGGIIGRASLFVASTAVPFLIIVAVLKVAGVFDKFWFWAVAYARQYVSEIPLSAAKKVFVDNTKMMMMPSLWVWIIAGLGLVLLWVDNQSRKRAVFVTGFFIFAFLTICPGFFFRQHYYVTWMPALALLVGVFAGAGRNLLQRVGMPWPLTGLPTVVVVIVLIFTMNAQGEWLFHMPLETASRMMYGTCPWTESEKIAKYIKDRTTPNDTIAVLGSEPQIYFFADRKSATGYIYTYALMEPQAFATKMQKEMMSEIEKAKPKFIIVVAMRTSWLVRPDSDRTIIDDWMPRYTDENYNRVGVIMPVVHSTYYDVETEYVWGEQARTYAPPSGSEFILVYERK